MSSGQWRVVRAASTRAAFLFVLLLVVSWLAPTARAQMDAALQMELGNPSQRSQSGDGHQLLLIKRPQYALVYDNLNRFPTWVAWHLSKQDLGSVGRGVFIPDTRVAKEGYVVVTPSDYTRSGYDRGHNCPSADRTANVADNNAVFLMTNITPQAHGLNAGPWERLEIYCRQLAQQGNELFVYCGHGFSSPTHGTIGQDKIAVPDFGWKIVVVVPSGDGDPMKRITATTRVIAVKMPNINTVSRKDWREYRVSVGEIEKATGLLFFDALPKATADAMRDRVDFDQSAPSRMVATGGAVVSGASSEDAPVTAALPASPSDVWVNTRSGVYWKPGTRYYGKTKQGKYMSEPDAIKAGYRAAGGQ